jgi:hypothetical protein
MPFYNTNPFLFLLKYSKKWPNVRLLGNFSYSQKVKSEQIQQIYVILNYNDFRI